MLPALVRRGAIPSRVMMAAAISKQTEASVSASLNRAKWSDVKDEVFEIGEIMREGSTNHSVRLPTPTLKQDVHDQLRQLHSVVENKNRNEAYARVRTIKAMVKDELYHNRQHQMRAFSAMAQQRVDDFENTMHDLQWADVEGEVSQIQQLMHKGTTNHANNAPDVELEQFIERTIDDMKVMLEKNPTQRALVFGKVQALKRFVKQRLYNHLTTKDHIRAFEKEMQALRWSDVKNEMEQIHQLMQEGTTNFAVALPSPELEKAVDDGLREIDEMIQSNTSPVLHDRVFDRIHKLKGMIKAEIYK
jgi:hypothetical protein